MNALQEYKDSVQERLNSADLLVSKAVHENSILTERLETQERELEALRKRVAELEVDCQGAKDDRNSSVEDLQVIKDFFSHLCDVRVHSRPTEDEQGMWFNVSQKSHRSPAVALDYKLGFVRGAESGSTEIIYLPLLKQLTSQELSHLQKVLPEYMFDTLSFPLDALNQFYTKMSKCLNKERQ
ncbi:Csm1p KNAG_0I02720 [Huiozyma naganishii CBS 8797]|uniref:Monopolin complex subunit Csm1/Pcs1 C-terminal domain-containing protein n=1 Tax=Huiozyma naganishii (strain ATCC MYA-139 / BCRC 22969 / CBS 8797 / KCTC 17520 / NBRC 10181 / NCYC 3082 / Yp74L-3) TaxID=1071383 RepID=J7S2J4_HUIN7|nr:hypothetical protein KNAG_0I02720 [Kazachstania naganishii CBS 8797]CCK72057.1 hypothetical protein KNAG_0I02720 [Kazachstania naganishii CBS 8797]